MQMISCNKIMENELHMQLDLSNFLPMVNEGISPQSLSDQSFLRSNLCPLNTENESIIGLPIYSSFQGEPLKDCNMNFHELCLGGTSLASDNDVNNPSQSQREMLLSGYPYASSSSVPTSINFGYDGLVGGVNSKWGQNGFPYGLEPLQLSENQDANQWVLPNSANVCSNHTYGTDNELSLSLATCRPSLPCSASVQDCCSNMSCSGIINSQSQSSPHGNKELSLNFASNSRTHQFLQIVSGSRYLQVLQQILSEIASYSLTSIDQTSYSTGLVSSSSNHVFSSKHTSGFTDDNRSFDPAESAYQRQEVELKKSQLLALLQVVDDCYNQCFDEIHTVVSAFRAATEVDPQVHACFALRTISFFYKNLRERISNAILAMGMNSGSPRDNGRSSFEKSFIQKQWALQQLKRKDQQLWRPQRGLPERSVSVLRAWMFDNFLHPYPKDAEKHLLAIKSGLTRSQVSNWFINARVRLWKPLVEEMCAELNRRKGGRQNDEGNDYNNHHHNRSQLCISDYNQRFNT